LSRKYPISGASWPSVLGAKPAGLMRAPLTSPTPDVHPKPLPSPRPMYQVAPPSSGGVSTGAFFLRAPA